jgi:hypothetical protein
VADFGYQSFSLKFIDKRQEIEYQTNNFKESMKTHHLEMPFYLIFTYLLLATIFLSQHNLEDNAQNQLRKYMMVSYAISLSIVYFLSLLNKAALFGTINDLVSLWKTYICLFFLKKMFKEQSFGTDSDPHLGDSLCKGSLGHIHLNLSMSPYQPHFFIHLEK